MTAEPEQAQLPEPSETIHLPDPSYVPVIVAAGVTIAIVGVVVHWFLALSGSLVVLVAIIRWVADTRRDIAELPLEH